MKIIKIITLSFLSSLSTNLLAYNESELKINANIIAGCHLKVDDAIFNMEKVFSTGWPFNPTPVSPNLLSNNPRFKMLCTKGIPLHIYVEKNEYNQLAGGVNSLKHQTLNEYIPYFIGLGSFPRIANLEGLDHFSLSYDPAYRFPNIPASSNIGEEINVPLYMSLRDVKFIPNQGVYQGSLSFSIIY